MAFTLQQSWHFVEERPCGPPFSESPLLRLLARSGIGRHVRRGGGTALTVLIHVVLLWIVLNKLAGPAAEEVRAKPPPLTFQLTTASAAAGSPTPQPPQSTSAPQPSPLDTTVPTELPAREWTVSRIAVRAAPAPAPAASGIYGAGAAGAGAYDPFAGAAPLRLDGAAGASGGLAFNAAALAAVKGNVERRLASCRGSVLLSVQVSPSGQVTQAEVRGGSAPAEAKAALQRETLGKRLFVGAARAPERRDLPEVRFCG